MLTSCKGSCTSFWSLRCATLCLGILSVPVHTQCKGPVPGLYNGPHSFLGHGCSPIYSPFRFHMNEAGRSRLDPIWSDSGSPQRRSLPVQFETVTVVPPHQVAPRVMQFQTPTGAAVGAVPLSELPAFITQAAARSNVLRDADLRGRPLRVADQTYARGLAMPAGASLTLSLPRGFTNVTALIGITDADQSCLEDALKRTAVRLQVQIDHRTVQHTEWLAVGAPLRPLSVAVAGARTLRLTATAQGANECVQVLLVQAFAHR